MAWRHMGALAMFVGAMSASGATLDLAPPPWERWDPPSSVHPYATYAVWNFDSDPGADHSGSPDNASVILSNPRASLLSGNSATFPDRAVWNDGAWDFSLDGVIDISLTNVDDARPVKFVRAQITWTGDVQNAPRFYVVSAYHPSVPDFGRIPLDGGMIIDTDPFGTHTFDDQAQRWHSLYLAEIRPNPSNENFDIRMFAGTSIDGVIIDTYSAVPEPSRAILGLFGVFLAAWALPRRRARSGPPHRRGDLGVRSSKLKECRS